MMIFNPFIAVNDFNFGTQMNLAITFSYQQNKTFKGICLAVMGTFLQEKLHVNSFCIQNRFVKSPFNLVLCLFMNLSAK